MTEVSLYRLDITCCHNTAQSITTYSYRLFYKCNFS